MIALAVGIPAAILTDVPNFRTQFFASSEPVIFVAADSVPVGDSVVLQLLILSMLLQYAQTMGSLFVLSEVSAVTHQVSATLKRLVIILSSILYFGNEVVFLNYVGVFLALAGFFAYGRSGLKCKGEDRSDPDQLPVTIQSPTKPNWPTRSTIDIFRPLSQNNLLTGLKLAVGQVVD